MITDDSPIPSVTITEEDFQHAFGVRQDESVAVIAKKGVSADASRAAVEDAARAYPMVKVSSLTDVKDQFTKALDQLFILVGALLGLAIIISLIGIANTLTLSVVERTRESALLRALGLTRRGLRWMLSLEAVIMAVIGALMGDRPGHRLRLGGPDGQLQRRRPRLPGDPCPGLRPGRGPGGPARRCHPEPSRREGVHRGVPGRRLTRPVRNRPCEVVERHLTGPTSYAGRLRGPPSGTREGLERTNDRF